MNRSGLVRGGLVLALSAALAAAMVISPATAKKKAVTAKKARTIARQEVAAAGGIYSVHRDSAGTTIPITATGAASDPASTLATLNVPAGTYAIFGKIILQQISGDDFVDCALAAGGDVDVAAVTMDAVSSSQQTPALNVVHTFAGDGTITLGCSDFSGNSGYKYLRMTAVEGSSLSNLSV